MKSVLRFTILFFIVFFSFNTNAQEIDQDALYALPKAKRNQIGMDLSLGFSIIYHSRTQPSYATGLNYTRISKSKRWAFEFGVRYTQLNSKSDKRYNSYVGPFAKDTFTLSRGFTSFFDIPVNFKRLVKINEKSNFVFNLGVFYTTYIQNHVRWKTYLSADNSLLSQGSRNISMFHYLKVGIDLGLGFNRKIKNDAEIYFTLHPVNVRFEIGEGGEYGFPNLSVGYRKSF